MVKQLWLGKHSVCCRVTWLILHLFIEHQCVESCSKKKWFLCTSFSPLPHRNSLCCLGGTVEPTFPLRLRKVRCAAELESSEELWLKSFADSCSIRLGRVSSAHEEREAVLAGGGWGREWHRVAGERCWSKDGQRRVAAAARSRGS